MAASIKYCGRPFRGEVWGGFAAPAKNRGVWGAAPPIQKRNVIKKAFLEKALSRKAFNSMVPDATKRKAIVPVFIWRLADTTLLLTDVTLKYAVPDSPT